FLCALENTGRVDFLALKFLLRLLLRAEPLQVLVPAWRRRRCNLSPAIAISLLRLLAVTQKRASRLGHLLRGAHFHRHPSNVPVREPAFEIMNRLLGDGDGGFFACVTSQASERVASAVHRHLLLGCCCS